MGAFQDWNITGARGFLAISLIYAKKCFRLSCSYEKRLQITTFFQVIFFSKYCLSGSMTVWSGLEHHTILELGFEVNLHIDKNLLLVHRKNSLLCYLLRFKVQRIHWAFKKFRVREWIKVEIVRLASSHKKDWNITLRFELTSWH